jgi:hypothetical protein
VTVWPSLESGTATVADEVEMLDVRMVGAVGAACAVGGLVGVRPGGTGGATAPEAVLDRRIGGGAGGGKRAPEGGGTEGAAVGGTAGGGSGAAAGSGGFVGSEPGGFVTAGPRGTAGMGGGTTISVLAGAPAVSVPPGGITTPTSVFGFPGSGGGAPEGTGSGGGMLSHPLSISIDSPLSRSPSSDLPVLLSVPATISDATQDAVQAKGAAASGGLGRAGGRPASARGRG